VCGIGGVAAFLVALLILRMGFVYAAGLGVAVWVGLSLVLSEGQSVGQVPKSTGISAEQVSRIIRDGERKVASMRRQARRIDDRSVRDKVRSIAEVAERIFADLREDPKDVRAARRFLEYYLDATLLVVERYVDLSSKGSQSADVQQVLGKFGDLLDTIQSTFEKQLDRLLRDDVLDLDTDITVLKQMMEMEGL